MSFVMDPETSQMEEGEQHTWMKRLEEEVTGSPRSVARRRRASASLQAIKAQKLGRQLMGVWGIMLLLYAAYFGVHLAARKTKRGKDNAMWLITVALIDSSLALGSLFLSGLGLWLHDEIYMRQSSILQVLTASWNVIEVVFNVIFVVILSKIGGEWQRHGKYTLEQIEQFNTFVTVLVGLGGVVAPITFLGSKRASNTSTVAQSVAYRGITYTSVL